eukprot:9494890-Pyramimonas_sp.AAC.1
MPQHALLYSPGNGGAYLCRDGDGRRRHRRESQGHLETSTSDQTSCQCILGGGPRSCASTSNGRATPPRGRLAAAGAPQS